MIINTPALIEDAVKRIITLTSYLVSVEQSDPDLSVNIKPTSKGFTVLVRYGAFGVMETAETIGDALTSILARLMTAVSAKIERGNKLLAEES